MDREDKVKALQEIIEEAQKSKDMWLMLCAVDELRRVRRSKSEP